MKLHAATFEEARALVDPIVRDWEIEVELARSRGELRFVFEDAEIIDRTPSTSRDVKGHAMVALTGSYLATMGNLTCHITRRQYPDPPVGFRLTPDAESILLGFRGYQDGREPLLSMAYFCLTVVESTATARDRRKNAAQMFSIEEGVLDKLGDLTANRGDRSDARKARSSTQALTGTERAWIESTIKQLVLQLCDPAAGCERKPLTMTSLPPFTGS